MYNITQNSNGLKTVFHKHIKHLCTIIVCVALATFLVQSRWFGAIDHYFYDVFLSNIPSKEAEKYRISVIEIDDETLDEIEPPIALLVGHLATVLNALEEVGAKAVVFDIIPAISLSKFAPEKDAAFMDAISNAMMSGTKVCLGFKTGKIGYEMPHRKFLFLKPGPPYLGFLNMYPDSDGKVRRQILYVPDEKEAFNSSIALRAAMAYSGYEKTSKEYVCERLAGGGNLPALPSVWVDYRINMKCVERHSFRDVLENADTDNYQELREDFSGKVVLIGSTSSKLADNNPAPFNPVDRQQKYTPGIIVHAMTTLTILSEDHFNEVPGYLTLCLTAVLAIFVSVLVFTVSPIRSLIILAGILVTGFMVLATMFYVYEIVSTAVLICGLVVPGFISGSYFYTVEDRQYRRLRKYFKSYVNYHVMDEIIRNPENVFEGNLVNVSVMFADIRNFVTISEKIKPAEIVIGLNRYLSDMADAIISVDGYVNRYVGDGILAIFGAPNWLPENGATAAVKGGLEMLRRLDELNMNEIFPGIKEIEIGIGIHTGEAIVGNIGSLKKLDYTIVGDTPNLASRIENLTKKYHTPLLISGTTYSIVRGRINAEYVDSVKVKGKENDVELYKVVV
ncbi:MAG: adenylate/guanylate cyclase domain-containing protein [Planctomycetes bacterium]|nr:adenylate/guanylate cyclase domain-containing protein [Planctomycetota bacterium]